mmetsp:Transcript_19453/g.21756  ORF Transcript_19453/g.21756 Transcript_19453/m.21756 type:complete len:133 (+) Transcript_19453:31-429(+)
MPSNDGIQKLLQAEDEAASVIDRARKNRVLRLRQAEEEAGKVVEAFRKQQEAEFQTSVNERDDDTELFFGKLDAETQKNMMQLTLRYTEQKALVSDMLMHYVSTVKLEVSEAQVQAAQNKAKALAAKAARAR